MRSNGVEVRQATHAAAEGPLRVWEMPDPKDRYVIGADVAEGLEHGDYSSASVLSVLSGNLVATWHGKIDPDQFGETLFMLGAFYGYALLGVESNNHGLTTLTALRQLGYPKLYRQQGTMDEVTKKPKMRLGWRTDKATKPLMIDELNRALREQHIKVHDEFTLAELRTYVRDERGRMGGQPHDDRVMSLAIANQLRQVAFMPEYLDPKNDAYTFDWWVKLADGGPSGEYVIGVHNTR